MRLKMWKVAVFLLFYVIINIVTTAPLYHQNSRADYGRGPLYTVRSPEQHRPYIEVRNSTYHGSGPREEARAMCSVRTQEVNATANATITRRLHGVVTSRELHSAIQRLEVIIFGQMQQLWHSLDALRGQLAGDARAPLPDRRTISYLVKPGMH